jgi:hypothetical protein
MLPTHIKIPTVSEVVFHGVIMKSNKVKLSCSSLMHSNRPEYLITLEVKFLRDYDIWDDPIKL